MTVSYTYKYFYTVDAYINWNDAFLTENIGSNLDFVEGEWDPALYPEWIMIHKESLSTKAVKWTIQKDYTVKWRIRFYCERTPSDNSGKKYWWLNNRVVQNVHVTFPDSAQLDNNSPGIQTVTGKTWLPEDNPVTHIENPTRGSTFTFWTHPNKSNFQFGKFTVTATVNAGDSYNDFGGDPSTDNKTFTMRGVFPEFVVYNAKPIPPLPPVFRAALDDMTDFKLPANSGGSAAGATPYAFDRCKNQWYGISKTGNYTGAKTANKVGYKYRIITCAPNGTGLKKQPIVPEDMPGNQITGREGPKLIKDRQALQTIILANCSGQGNGSSGGNKHTVKDPKPVDMSDMRWNPPPHTYARSLPYGVLMDSLQTANGQPGDYTYYQDILRNLERGRIFQDTVGASVLNTNPDKLDLPEGDRWGFRFMYNPTTFGYGTASNNSVDWTQGPKDVSILMSGNSSVSFELYINRIPDMAYLKDYRSKAYLGSTLAVGGNPYLDPMSSVYGRDLKDQEITGLLNRGTEYDIEFLYRVLNGDPIKKSLLLSPEYDGYTADFGYTTATPCWLYLNDNMRYFGSVMSFNVNHVMFTTDMVPMLSVVSIQYSRIPALFDVNDSNDQKKAALKKFIAGTPTS